jgi:hypothetical protein
MAPPSSYIRNILRGGGGAAGAVAAVAAPSTTVAVTARMPLTKTTAFPAQQVGEETTENQQWDDTDVDSSSYEGAEMSSEYKSTKNQQKQPTPRFSSKAGAAASSAVHTRSSPTTISSQSHHDVNNEVPDVFVSKMVAPIRRQRRHSMPKCTGGAAAGGGHVSTLSSSVANDKSHQQEQGDSNTDPKKEQALKCSSHWLSAPKTDPRKIASFFTGGGSINKSVSASNKTRSSHLKEASKTAVAAQQHHHTSSVAPTAKPAARHPLLNRGGQVTLTGQQAYFGRRAASTRSVSETCTGDDNDEDTSFNDSTRGSTRGLFTSISTGLIAIPDEDKESRSSSKSVVAPRKPKVLNRGGQCAAAAGSHNNGLVGRRSASMRSLLTYYDTILSDFNDSARPLNDSARVVAPTTARRASAHAGYFPGHTALLEENEQDTNNKLGTTNNKVILNRGGQLGFPALTTTQAPQPQRAYLGHRSVSAHNVLLSYETILKEFNDSILCINDASPARNGGSVWQSSIVSSSIPGPPNTDRPLKQKRRNSTGGGFSYPKNYSSNVSKANDSTTADNKALSVTQLHEARGAGSTRKTAAIVTATASPRQANSQTRNGIWAGKANPAAMEQVCLDGRPVVRQPHPKQPQRTQRRNSASGGSNIHMTNNRTLSTRCHANMKRGSNQELSASCHSYTNSSQVKLSPTATAPQRQARLRRNSMGIQRLGASLAFHRRFEPLVTRESHKYYLFCCSFTTHGSETVDCLVVSLVVSATHKFNGKVQV